MCPNKHEHALGSGPVFSAGYVESISSKAWKGMDTFDQLITYHISGCLANAKIYFTLVKSGDNTVGVTVQNVQ